LRGGSRLKTSGGKIGVDVRDSGSHSMKDTLKRGFLQGHFTQHKVCQSS